LNDKGTVPIPEAIAQLQGQFDQFRSAQSHRGKIPEALWQAAVELAREHGLYAVAHPLRVDYVGLKRPPGRRQGGFGKEEGRFAGIRGMDPRLIPGQQRSV
jgi:hypothetical protein